MTETSTALDGIVVLDASHVLAGPYCAMLLADLGATVIKIEPPWGDEVRKTPPMMGDRCAAFDQVNRNKSSICLDFRNPAHIDIFLELVDRADVLVENLRPGKLAQYGLGYEALSARNSRLIMGSISGYGQTGAYAARGGYDLMAQAESGIMSVTGYAEGEPLKCGLPIADISSALFLTQGILAALHHRSRTGLGQYVETSLYESAIALSVWQASQYWGAGRITGRHGNGHPLMVPYGAFETSDRPIVVAGHSERFWPAFCKAIDAEFLLADPRFATASERVRLRRELDAIVQGKLRERDRASWLELFAARDIPAAPVQTYDDVYNDPHARERGMIVEDAGGINVIGNPVRLSRTPWQFRKRAPQVGEDTEEVLRWLGLDEPAILQFKADQEMSE